MPNPLDIVRALVRNDFASFSRKAFSQLHDGHDQREAPHLPYYAGLVEDVDKGHTNRLIVNAPPRSLKSFVLVVAHSAWRLGQRPGDKVMLVSHDEKLANAHADGVRRIMEAPWYHAAFPNSVLRPDHNRLGDFRTTAGGHIFARSMEAGVTGHGADMIIFDDPHDAGDIQSEASRDRVHRLIVEKYASRLNSQATGVILLVMQRLHPDDVTGRLVAAGGYRHEELPLIADVEVAYPTLGGKVWRRLAGDVLDPDAWPDQSLEAFRRSIPAYVWSSQYQQVPVSPTSGVLHEEWFTLVDSVPASRVETFISVDAAGAETEAGSYSAIAVIHRVDKNIYVGDMWRGRVDFEGLKTKVCLIAAAHREPRLLIEEAALGVALISSLKAKGLRVVAIPKPTVPKLTRLESVFDVFAERRVHLPRHEPWLRDFIDECVQFPGGTFNDQLDALVQCLRWLKEGHHSPPMPFIVGGPSLYRSGPHPLRDPRRPPSQMMPRPAFRGARGPVRR